MSTYDEISNDSLLGKRSSTIDAETLYFDTNAEAKIDRSEGTITSALMFDSSLEASLKRVKPCLGLDLNENSAVQLDEIPKRPTETDIDNCEDYVVLDDITAGFVLSAKSDDAAAVAEHYSQREDLGRVARKESVILNLRGLNNFIKATLISNALNQCQQNGRSVSVLDLCGGKGGDLGKFANAKISHYVLADIAKGSVEDAMKRYNDRLPQNTGGPRRFGYTFPAKFFAGDLSALRLHYVMDPNIMFDFVSCQFAFHYCFKDEASARRMLENVTDRLKPGGLFVATIPDANVLVRNLRSAGRSSFGNSVYRVTFADPRLQGKNLKRRAADGTLIDAGIGPSTPAQLGDQMSIQAIESAEAKSLITALREDMHAGSHKYEEQYSLLSSKSEKDRAKISLETVSAELDELGIRSSSDPFSSKGEVSSNSQDQESEKRFWSTITFPASEPFGIRYNFFLADAVEHVDEFLVHFPTLCALASQYGLLPILHENFASLFANRVTAEAIKDVQLSKQLENMQVFKNDTISADEWEAACIYCAVGFIKVDPSDLPAGSVVCAPPDPTDAGRLSTKPMEFKSRAMQPEDLVVMPPESAD